MLHVASAIPLCRRIALSDGFPSITPQVLLSASVSINTPLKTKHGTHYINE